jgi:hypothetical protein
LIPDLALSSIASDVGIVLSADLWIAGTLLMAVLVILHQCIAVPFRRKRLKLSLE